MMEYLDKKSIKCLKIINKYQSIGEFQLLALMGNNQDFNRQVINYLRINEYVLDTGARYVHIAQSLRETKIGQSVYSLSPKGKSYLENTFKAFLGKWIPYAITTTISVAALAVAIVSIYLQYR